MAQPLVAFGRQQAVAEERDQHPGAEALPEVGCPVDQDLLDLRRAVGHVRAERPEPDRDEVAVLVPPAEHRADRVGAVLAHRPRHEPPLGPVPV